MHSTHICSKKTNKISRCQLTYRLLEILIRHVNVQQDVFQAENCKAPRVLTTIKNLVTFSNPPIVYSYTY